MEREMAHLSSTANLKRRPQQINLELRFDCSNVTRFITLLMSFTDPHGGLNCKMLDNSMKKCFYNVLGRVKLFYHTCPKLSPIELEFQVE